MEERRRNRRTKLSSSIVMKRLDNGREEEVDIEVVDISKAGVGFTCSEPLMIGAIYEAYLTIWTKEVLHAVVEIVKIRFPMVPFSWVCRKWMPSALKPIRRWKTGSK